MTTKFAALARRVHRWTGLALGGFIVLAGLTGTLLVFQHELDDWFKAGLHRRVQAGPAQSLSALQDAIEARHAPATVRRMQLDGGPGRAMLVELARPGGATPGTSFQIWVDPASGATLGERQAGAARLDQRHIMPFLFRLHRMLLLGETGKTITGVIALAWLLSTVIGAWLAWPRHGHWRQALTVKFGASNFRAQYDLHRAAGLLSAPAFILITFSGVYFNLDDAVKPVINAVSPLTKPPTRQLKKVAAAEVAVTPEQALALAQQQYPDSRPWRLIVDRAHGAYRADLFRPNDIGHTGNTRVFVDMRTPRIVGALAPETRSAGDTFAAWQFPLHTGQFLGIGGQLLWGVLGLLPLLMAITGITIWLKKRRSERVARARRAAILVRA